METQTKKNKYQRGKIYKIQSNQTNKFYIGSTCEPTLAKRLAGHVGDYKRWKQGTSVKKYSSFDILQYSDYKIVLIESFPCNSRDEQGIPHNDGDTCT